MARLARLALAVCALVLGAALPAFAQMPEGTLTTSAAASPAKIEAGGAGTIAVTFVVADGFHIYGNEHQYTPTKVEPLAAPGFTFGAAAYPKATIVEEWGEKVPEYFKTVVVKVPFTVAAGAKPGAHTLTVHLAYQVCNKEMCYDPVSKEPLTVNVTVLPPPAAPEANPATPADPGPPAVPADPPADPAPPIQELPGLPGGGNPEDAAIELLKVEPAVDGVALTLRVTEGWHFFSFNHGAQGYFEGTVTITLPLVYDKGATAVEGKLTFQLCDPGNCVDREVAIRFPVPADAVTDGAAIELPPAHPKAAAAGPSDTAPDTAGGDDDLRNKGLGAFLVACVLGGLFSLIMPCVYPLIPVTVTFFAKQAGDDGQGKTV
ncbi:MAG: protein-disulfide reductase DsbD domain-containing protein, partial [Planctomycetota bacterium]